MPGKEDEGRFDPEQEQRSDEDRRTDRREHEQKNHPIHRTIVRSHTLQRDHAYPFSPPRGEKVPKADEGPR